MKLKKWLVTVDDGALRAPYCAMEHWKTWDASCGQGPLPGRVATEVKSRQNQESAPGREKSVRAPREHTDR